MIPQKRKSKDQGFTLIELMIVIAIIGVLGAVAVPRYQSYTVRSEVAAGFATLQNLKGPVEEFFLTEGKFPTSNDDKDQIGVTASSLGEITLSKDEKVAGAGTVTFTFGDKAKPETKGKTLLLARDKDGGWGCKAGGIDNKYLPATCRAADTKTADTKTTETPKID